MRTKYKFNPTTPYSLHDMRINKIVIKEDKIYLYFENGYVEAKEPYNQVDGYIIIEGVDFDFVSVHVLSDNGQYGRFAGEKLSLEDFLKKYEWTNFEVVDEFHGYDQVLYSGYLSVKDKDSFIAMDLSVYYEGNIVYDTHF